MKEIHQKLKAEYGDCPPSEEFGKLAMEYSECPTGPKGGLLGYFGKG